MNLTGSLKVESITRENLPTAISPNTPQSKTKPKTAPITTEKSQVTFIQDQVGISDLGPSVKVDLGSMAAKEFR